MKNLKFYSILLTGAMILSCSSDDKTVDQVLSDTTRGAVLRTIEATNDMVYNEVSLEFEAGSSYSLTIEEQDAQDGQLLSLVNAYVRLIDNTRTDTDGDGDIDEDDDDFSTDEVLITTVQASEFSPGPYGFPRATLSFTSDELLAATVANDDLPRGLDQFALRLELVLTDGRVFTNDASGNVTGGSFFSSPFDYRVDISCAITENLSGDHTYVTTDMIAGDEDGTCGFIVSGTVTWDNTETPGVYTTSDLAFGQFDSCYGDDPATSSTAMVEWDCRSFVTLGEDQNENTYTYKITNVAGPDMTISWSNTNGDSGITVLTREGGVPWPDIFLANNE